MHHLLTLNAKGQVIQRRERVFEGITHCSIEPGATYQKELHIDIPNTIAPSVTLGTLILRSYEITLELSVTMSPTNISLSFPLDIYDPFHQDPNILKQFNKTGSIAQSITVTPATIEPTLPLPNLPDKPENRLEKKRSQIDDSTAQLAKHYLNQKPNSWADVPL